MMKYIPSGLLTALSLFLFACSSTKKTVTPEDISGMQHETLDEIVVMPPASEASPAETYPLRETRERKWDLLHTSLELSFDWDQQAVKGKATLTLTPLFYQQDTLKLDAVRFDVHQMIVQNKVTSEYRNTGDQLVIPMPRSYKQGEEVRVEITYTAHPQDIELVEGQAITSNQGLFFIDPLDTIPGLSRQIWTQGETSSNRNWYPTLDQPNERNTQEIILTVPDTMLTLSNGVLISSTVTSPGMRQDHWKLDLPHAPYLAMVAVGTWDKVSDFWRGRPIDYYVSKGYGPDARAIFAHTTEMLDFFSSTLDYPFVWPKYSQIIVDQFVTGAMENTTAVTFGDFILLRKDEVIVEGANDYIVAHEMFHHWFGDLVTCESWAHIALNEGFANYAEYLWSEHKYGREKADLGRMDELSGYFDQASYEVHPLIDFHYKDETTIFDAHSYNKGGLVLHMLRDIVGDKAFFSALHLYLKRHQFSTVEVEDLRHAFEDVTGKDLRWFFDQWYFGTGHPVLQVHHEYIDSTHTLQLHIEQTQTDKGYTELYRLPLEVSVFDADTIESRQQCWMDSTQQTFSFTCKTEPLAVVFDPRDILLAEVNHQVDPAEYPIRALYAPSVSHRISAIRLLDSMDVSMTRKLMFDTSVMSRALVIQYFADHGDVASLAQMMQKEENAEMQYYLMESIAGLDAEKAKDAAISLLAKTNKVPLIYMAIQSIAATDLDEALHQLSHFKDINSSSMYSMRASLYAQKDGLLTLDYFLTPQAAAMDERYLEEFIHSMAQYLSSQSMEEQQKGISYINSDFFLRTPDNQYRRFFLLTGIYLQHEAEEDGPYKDLLRQTMKSLYQKETDPYLLQILEDGLGSLLE